MAAIDESILFFDQKEWEAHVSRWTELEQRAGLDRIEKGAIIDSIERNYGENSVEKFAWDAGETSVRSLYEYAQLTRRIRDLENCARAQILDSIGNGMLKYSHVREASRKIVSDNDLMSILAEAQDEDWRVKRLQEEVALRYTSANVASERNRDAIQEEWTAKPLAPIRDLDDEESLVHPPSSPVDEHGEPELVETEEVPDPDEAALRLTENVRSLCRLMKDRDDPDGVLIKSIRMAVTALVELECEMLERSPRS